MIPLKHMTSSKNLDLFALSSYQYDLPAELIAQHPTSLRDDARLMLIDRKSGTITEKAFRELPDLLLAGDSLILNDTKVIPARLYGKRSNTLQNTAAHGEAEILLNKPLQSNLWEALARPGKKLKNGVYVIFGEDFACQIMDTLSDGSKVVRLIFDEHVHALDTLLARYGQLALPHYIARSQGQDPVEDIQRYQTVYAANSGAIAAPTAGLHFTPQLLETLCAKGVATLPVTLHVGPGTFRPVKVDDIRAHLMHNERYVIPKSTADQLNASLAAGSTGLRPKQICVGTTSCRAIESAADEKGVVQAGSFDTQIFIYPGYRFKRVDALLTNFHLPGSTLLMLVSAFAGYELIKEAYTKAVKERFRFFSYGDAMLIL